MNASSPSLRVMALAASALVFASACGKKEEPKAAAPAPAAAPTAAAPAPAPAPAAPLKIAFAYVGPVGDAGWTFAHDQGRKAVEAEFGDKVKTSYVENVPEAADAERVIRQMVSEGNKLVFGTTFGYMDPMMKVAADHKEVKFEHGTGFKTADNMRTYDSRTYEGAYMAGVIAGAMTKTNTLGVVASQKNGKEVTYAATDTGRFSHALSRPATSFCRSKRSRVPSFLTTMYGISSIRS